MDIELLIERLQNYNNFFNRPRICIAYKEYQILASLLVQISQNIGLTKKQSVMAIRIIEKYKDQLSHEFSIDLDDFLKAPVFRYPIRNIPLNKKISLFKNKDSNSSQIKIEFPYDLDIINLIKTHSANCKKMHIPTDITWDPEKFSWMMNVNENNILFLEKNLLPLGFSIDDKITEVIDEVKLATNDLDSCVPMLIYDHGKFLIKNNIFSIPSLETNDLIEALFFCKKYHITIWDDNIELMISELPESIKYLFENPDKLSLDLTKESLNVLTKFSDKILCIIPGGNELECLSHVYKIFLDLGIDNSEMSVLFRSNKNNKINSFIKESRLNFPTTDQTKIIFISGKLPKPLVKKKITFDTIIHFGIEPAHYLLSTYINSHYFTIKYKIPEKNA